LRHLVPQFFGHVERAGLSPFLPGEERRLVNGAFAGTAAARVATPQAWVTLRDAGRNGATWARRSSTFRPAALVAIALAAFFMT